MTEDGRKFVEKLAGAAKIRKDQCLIVILTGVLLCVIALPVGQKDAKSRISDMKDDTIENHTAVKTESDGHNISQGQNAYAEYWEDCLEDALKYVEGVGKVKVLITLKESEQKIVEKDGPEEHSETTEADSAGGSRTVVEDKVEKSTVYTVDERGQNVPYVVRTIPPAVEGVVVIAQGAGRQTVQENIIEAIQVLFGIDANKIKIVKMKNKQ